MTLLLMGEPGTERPCWPCDRRKLNMPLIVLNVKSPELLELSISMTP
jgi:hypothetical protein